MPDNDNIKPHGKLELDIVRKAFAGALATDPDAWVSSEDSPWLTVETVLDPAVVSAAGGDAGAIMETVMREMVRRAVDALGVLPNMLRWSPQVRVEQTEDGTHAVARVRRATAEDEHVG